MSYFGYDLHKLICEKVSEKVARGIPDVEEIETQSNSFNAY